MLYCFQFFTGSHIIDIIIFAVIYKIHIIDYESNEEIRKELHVSNLNEVTADYKFKWILLPVHVTCHSSVSRYVLFTCHLPPFCITTSRCLSRVPVCIALFLVHMSPTAVLYRATLRMHSYSPVGHIQACRYSDCGVHEQTTLSATVGFFFSIWK